MSTVRFSEESIFEINDFTTSTPWESFIANIEEILLEWKNEVIEHDANCEKQAVGCTHILTEDVGFGTDALQFTFTYYRVFRHQQQQQQQQPQQQQKVSSIDHQFWLESFSLETNVTNIFKWFSMCRYAVLKPKLSSSSASSSVDVTRDESSLNFILSSASVALHNTGSEVPVFVQGHTGNGHLFYGHELRSGFFSTHDMVHLRHIPAAYCHLSGLVDVFTNKMACIEAPDIYVSVRFTYFLLDNQPELVPRIAMAEPDHKKTKLLNHDRDRFKLPFGTIKNSISSLGLFASWHNLPHQNVVDNAIYSDLDHCNAHECHLIVNRLQTVTGHLSRLVGKFNDLRTVNIPFSDLLYKYLIRPPSDEADLADAFSPLTGVTSSSNTSSAISLLSFKSSMLPPLNGDGLAPLLSFIFPDGWRGNDWYPNLENSKDMQYSPKTENSSQFDQLKSTPHDSLLSRLCRVLGLVNVNYSKDRDYCSIANVWHEFLFEIQSRWRGAQAMIIPGLQSGSPNMSYCLLYQKLQMLNCCIERVRTRNQTAWKQSNPRPVEPPSSDDEFYECHEEADDVSKGRLRAYNDLRLLDDLREVKDDTRPRLYIPVTQNAGPLTEDMLEEQADLLARLGTTSEGAHVRARMQSAGLLSDMESFKAANPGCSLPDFVRWYSPRDWVLDDPHSDTGSLSPRMNIEGNIWQNLWKSARQVPVQRQKRLFDDTKEAEKILHWLSSLTLAQVCTLLMPVLVHETLITLHEKIEQTSSMKLTDIVKNMTTHAVQLTRDNHGSFQVFCGNLTEVERLISHNISLTSRLTSSHECASCQSNSYLRDLSTRLLESPFASIDKCRKCESYAGSIFSDKKSLWHREYTLRCQARRPSANSRPSGQRLYASITPKEQYLIGSFCNDTTFK